MSSNAPETRSRILTVTWKLMEEQQGKGVRMSDIAKAAGITRQALYLHFASRTELLVATTRYIDEVRDMNKRLKHWNAATTGEEMVDAFVSFWGNYIPEIYGLAKALWAVYDTDEAASEAWRDRMSAIKSSCKKMVAQLAAEENLSTDLTQSEATDLFAALLSIRNWEQLTIEYKWTNKQYIHHMKRLIKQSLIRELSSIGLASSLP